MGQENRCDNKIFETALSKPRAGRSAATSCHGGRRANNTKTRERTEGAATSVQAMHGDSCTAQKVQDGPKTSISFGVKAESPCLPCREDIVVESGDAAPKSCLPSLEMRTTTATGGLVPTGKSSTATETTFNEQLLRFYATEGTNSKKKKLWTSTPSTWCDSNFWKLLPPPPA